MARSSVVVTAHSLAPPPPPLQPLIRPLTSPGIQSWLPLLSSYRQFPPCPASWILSVALPASNIHPNLGCHTAFCFHAHATWEIQICGTGPARGVFSQLRLWCCLIIFLPPALGQSFSYYPQWPLIPSSIPLLNPSVLPGYTWPFLFHVSKLRLSDMTSLNSYTPLFPNQSLPTFSFTAPPPPTKSLGEFFFF